MKIDDGKLFAAISGSKENAFIHRRTGEIVFGRGAIESSPQDWVLIPQYRGGNGGEEAYIQQFLEEHAIGKEDK
jgi:hypothetical protein